MLTSIQSVDIPEYISGLFDIIHTYTYGTEAEKDKVLINVWSLARNIDRYNVTQSYLFLGILRMLKQSSNREMLDRIKRIDNISYRYVVDNFLKHLLISKPELSWPDILFNLCNNSVDPMQMQKATEILQEYLNKPGLF